MSQWLSHPVLLHLSEIAAFCGGGAPFSLKMWLWWLQQAGLLEAALYTQCLGLQSPSQLPDLFCTLRVQSRTAWLDTGFHILLPLVMSLSNSPVSSRAFSFIYFRPLVFAHGLCSLLSAKLWRKFCFQPTIPRSPWIHALSDGKKKCWMPPSCGWSSKF